MRPLENEARPGKGGTSTRSSTNSLPADQGPGQAVERKPTISNGSDRRCRSARAGSGRSDQPVDRLPSRNDLLDAIEWQAYVIDELAADRNRLAADLAELICDPGAAS